MENKAIYTITKKTNWGYGKKKEFEISFNQKLNLWECFELIELDSGEVHSKLKDRGQDIITISHALI